MACITVDRPKHLGRFSEEMVQLWAAALENIRDRDDTHVVLLSGNGKAFCAGGDVETIAAGEGFFEGNNDITSIVFAGENTPWRGTRRIPLTLEEIDKPVIVKIHSATAEAGLDITLICDIRITSESASPLESYFNAGIVPSDSGAYFLPRPAGRDKALDLFLTARVLEGIEAEKIGLVTRVVPDDQLDGYVEQYIQGLMDAPQQAMRLTKRAIDQSGQSSLHSSLDLVSFFMGVMTELGNYHTQTAALVERLNRKSKT